MSMYEATPTREPTPEPKPDAEAILRPLLNHAHDAAVARRRLTGGGVSWPFAAGVEAGALEAALRAALQLLEVEW